jgi:glutathione S-transferase
MQARMSVTFFYSPQSSATRVHWALEELGIPYEKVKLDLRAGDQKKPDFLAINPNAKVPALVVDGTPMFESGAIQIYLGERYGVDKGLWPAANTAERAQALTWLVWGQVALGGTLMRYFYNAGQWVAAELQNAKAAEAALKDFHDHLRILDARLNGREFVVGDRFNLADLDIASMLGWGIPTAKVDVSAYPNLQDWLGRMTSRSAFKTAMAAS